ncbi:MAG TPA: radical SAM protein [Candidatus Competibacteraceae bacterium]|nr:radical SAM protein [Candidatus Competibacteraceae bacterium]HSA48034.1 radical SAM protein [Candidatus Competibacteraceae bacterium]
MEALPDIAPLPAGASRSRCMARVPLGCVFYLTTRCQQRCAHCWLECQPDQGADMDPAMFREIVQRAAAQGLLRVVTLTGGEPFIDPDRLLECIRELLAGHGVLEIFIPTNGLWVLADDYRVLAEELAFIGQFVPYELRIAWSMNRWNLKQLGRNARPVAQRWRELERRFPQVFRRRTLEREDMLALGRAGASGLARPGAHLGAHCSFDDWVDPSLGVGFYSDFLAFWPDGSVRACYMAGPVIGSYQEDYSALLDKRAAFLWQLRAELTGSPFGILPGTACSDCARRIPADA